MIISTSVGLFGPFDRHEILEDRIRVWPPGSITGADLPFNVIGDYEALDPDLPPDFDATTYAWVAGAFVRKST